MEKKLSDMKIAPEIINQLEYLKLENNRLVTERDVLAQAKEQLEINFKSARSMLDRNSEDSGRKTMREEEIRQQSYIKDLEMRLQAREAELNEIKVKYPIELFL